MEAIIALSIVFVAAEVVRGLRGKPGLTARASWVVAFRVGLLHGFGFAGARASMRTRCRPLARACRCRCRAGLLASQREIVVKPARSDRRRIGPRSQARRR